MKKERKNISANLRKKLILDFNSICQCCGNKESAIFEIHHIDRDPSNNNEDNLIPLCRTCHSKADLGNFSPSDLNIIINRKKCNQLKYYNDLEKKRKPISSKSSIKIGSIGNMNNSTIANMVKVSKPNNSSPIIIGSIASSIKHYNYIKHLFDRWKDFDRKNNFNKAKKYSESKCATTIIRVFGAKLKDIPIERFDDLSFYIQRQIDRTMIGSKQQKNYSSFEEYQEKYTKPKKGDTAFL